jgi:hypothetical protein
LQLLHVVQEVLPGSELNVLAGQAAHRPLMHCEPAGQSAHAEQVPVVTVPLALKKPVLHAHEGRPTSDAELAAHAVHVVVPAVALYVLARHGVHRPAAQALPAAHVEHAAHAAEVALPVAEKKPLLHVH